MNAHGFSNKWAGMVVAALLVAAAGTSLTADIPGGGGRLLTAYSAPARPTVAEVEQARQRASECRYLREAKVRDSREPLHGAAVGFLATNAPAGASVEEKPVFSLTLHPKKGPSRRIELSDIKSITVLKTKSPFLWLFGSEKALLEVVLFPTITPEALLAGPISYARLRDNYTTTVTGWVFLRQEQGKPLCLAAKTNDVYRVLARVKDLEPQKALLFDDRYNEKCLWWAVDSVIQDPAYPYRLMLAR